MAIDWLTIKLADNLVTFELSQQIDLIFATKKILLCYSRHDLKIYLTVINNLTENIVVSILRRSTKIVRMKLTDEVQHNMSIGSLLNPALL